jgi:hypothetical protein
MRREAGVYHAAPRTTRAVDNARRGFRIDSNVTAM